MVNEATSDEAKQKFRKLVKMFHPDNGRISDDSKMKHLNSISNDDTKIIDFYNEIVNPKKEELKKEKPKKEEFKKEKSETNRRSADAAYGYRGYSPVNKSTGKQKWEKRVKKFRKAFKKEKMKYGDYRDSDIFSGQTTKRRR